MKKISKLFTGLLSVLLVALMVSSCDMPDNVKPDPDPVKTPTFTVTFNANAGEAEVTKIPAPITEVLKGVKIVKPAEDPVRLGFTFNGWYTTAECKTIWNFSINTVNKDLTLYAKWIDAALTTYTITFDTGDSGWKIPSVTEVEGTKVDVLAYYYNASYSYMLTSPDFAVSDIYCEAGYINKLEDDSTVDYKNLELTADITFYVKMVPYITLTLDANGGKFSSGETSVSKEITKGSSLSWILEDYKPTKGGSVFGGWSTSATENEPVDGDSPVTESITLYAYWFTLNTAVTGYWVLDDDSSSNFFYLGSDGSGCYVTSDGFFPVTFNDSTITYRGSSHEYTLEEGIFTVEDISSPISYKRPSALGPTGTYATGKYIALGSVFTVGATGSLMVESLNEDGFSLTCTCSVDSDNFWLLDSEGKALLSIPKVNLLPVTTATLGGFYYNYAGTTAAENGDSYSVLLDTNGSYTLYLWGKEYIGEWGCYTQNASDYLLLKTEGSSEYYETSYSLTGAEFTVSSSDFSRSTTRGTVASFNGDSKLLGTWEADEGGMTLGVTFAANGIMSMSQSFEGETYSFEGYYSTKNGNLLQKEITARGLFSEVQLNHYGFDDTTLLIGEIELTKIN